MLAHPSSFLSLTGALIAAYRYNIRLYNLYIEVCYFWILFLVYFFLPFALLAIEIIYLDVYSVY